MLRDHRELPALRLMTGRSVEKTVKIARQTLPWVFAARYSSGRNRLGKQLSLHRRDCDSLGVLVNETRDLTEQILTLEQANELDLREIDAEALQDEIDRVWETVESMREAQVFTEEMLAREISV